MTALRWLAARKWGQILCFTGAAVLLVLAFSDSYNDQADRLKAAGLLLLTGLALKGLDIWRERGQR